MILLDTMDGTRIARAAERIAYSTVWNGGSSVRVAVDGTTLKNASAPASGEVVWNASAAGVGSHVLTHVCGAEADVHSEDGSVQGFVQGVYRSEGQAEGGSGEDRRRSCGWRCVRYGDDKESPEHRREDIVIVRASWFVVRGSWLN